MTEGLPTWMKVIFGVAGVALLLAIVILALLDRKLRRLRVPGDADFFTTLRIVPLSLVIGLDLLDLGLDVLAAPVAWALLKRYNLQALRNVATYEALIPFTGPIPTLTIAWVAARTLKLGRTPDPNVIETDRVGDTYVPRRQR